MAALPWLRGEKVLQRRGPLRPSTIAGLCVRCLSVAMQFRGHTGYGLPKRQITDLKLLRERFGDG